MASTNINNRGLIIFGSILAGTLLVIGVIIAMTIYRVKVFSNVISVTGSSQKNITSDQVKWRASISKTSIASGLGEANSQMAKDLIKVKDFLQKNGISPEQITIKPVTVNTLYQNQNYGGVYQGKPEYAGPGDQLVGYTLRQEIEVNSGDVKGVTNSAQESSKLINDGVLFSNDSLEYYYSKLADLKVEMLAAATLDAKERAKKISESAGSKVGALRSASMGVFQVTAMNSAEVSDYGVFDTSSIEKQITAVVRASFGVSD